MNQSLKVFVLWQTHTLQKTQCSSPLEIIQLESAQIPLVQQAGIACNNTSQGSKVHRGRWGRPSLTQPLYAGRASADTVKVFVGPAKLVR